MPLFDAHIDIFSHVYHRGLKGERDIFKKYHLKGFREGGMTSAIFAIYVDHHEDVGVMQKQALQQIKYAAIEIENNKDIIQVVEKYEDLQNAEKESRIAALISLEGLGFFDEDPDFLYPLYRFGVRSAMLSWNKDNNFGGGIKHGTGKRLTSEGRRAIKIMEEIGMIIDVSHSNFETISDVLEITTKPVIASHNNALAVSSSNKNLSDEVMMGIRQCGGVVGLNCIKGHISQKELTQNLDGVINQIDYMVNLIGIDHVGFGFDFMDFLLELEPDQIKREENRQKKNLGDLMKTSQVPNLIARLQDRGYSLEDIEKIKYKNFYRVIGNVLK